MFGGGGHLQASGFKIKGKTVEEVLGDVIPRIVAYQANRLNVLPAAHTVEIPTNDSKLTTERMTRLAERIAFVAEEANAKEVERKSGKKK
jgi:hypothetical protein